jgi:hypothetical protein
MTAKVRKALAAEAPKTDDEVTMLVERLQLFQAEREGLVADRDERRAKALADIEAKYGYDSDITKLDTALSEELVKLEAWADANRRTRFDKKSIEWSGAVFGWELGQPKTETLAKGTWGKVVEYLCGIIHRAKRTDATPSEVRAGDIAHSFIVTKVEPDKKAMIAARDNAAAMEVLLTAGAMVVQEEGFFFKRAGEGQQPSTLKSAA